MDEKRRALQEEANRVEKETGFRVDLPDYGEGTSLVIFGVVGMGPEPLDQLRYLLQGFAYGVAAERAKHHD